MGGNTSWHKTPQACCKLSILQAATSLLKSGSLQLVICRLVATCHLQTCYNLLKQLAASLWITSFDNQLATSLLTTCNRIIVNKVSPAMRTHPDIGSLITNLFQDVNRLARFWLGRIISISYCLESPRNCIHTSRTTPSK